MGKFKIITKINFIKKRNIKKFFLNKINKDLKDFKIKKYEAILLHNSKMLEGKNGLEYLRLLKELKKNNFCKYIGVSIYEPKEMKLILKFFKPDIIQAPLNIFDQRIIKSNWFRYFKKNNVKLHVRSIFLQKILLSDLDKLPTYFHRWKRNFKNFNTFCYNNKISKLDACFNYIYQFKNIQAIVIGIDNFSQINDIMNIKVSINKNILKDLNSFCVKDLKLIDPRNWKF